MSLREPVTSHTTADALPTAADELPFVAPLRIIGIDAPMRWLSLGWRDVCAAPAVSIAYGTGVFAVSAGMSFIGWRFGSGWMLLVLLSGFIFMGPVLAVGLYAVSSKLARGGRPSLPDCFVEARRRFSETLVFSLALMIICLTWVRAGSVVHIFYPDSGTPTIPELATFFLIGSAVGSLFALVTFAASAFSLPMLFERRTDSVTAVVTSVNAVLRNKAVMALWAAIIVGAVAIGFATALLGLIVTMPLIGYATWHGYRETIDASQWPEWDPT